MRRTSTIRFSVLCGLLILLSAVRLTLAQSPPEAAAVFRQYTVGVEERILRQHQSPTAFLHMDRQEGVGLRRGELIVEQLSPPGQPPGALLHHWRGTAFARGATAAQFERMLRDFQAYPVLFAPQVVAARALPQGSDSMHAQMRVRQKHGITVVMDASYDVSFGRLDLRDGYGTSHSTRISEIGAPGTAHEHALTPAEEHGFLWELNTYWTYQQRDGGLYLQIETVSLSRAIPTGLSWALRPYVTSIPRESLEFTLRSATQALHNETQP